MKIATVLGLVMLALSAAAGAADPLTDKSKAPDWGKASRAEKDAWIAAFAFKKANPDKAEVAGCLDRYAAKPLFEGSELSVTFVRTAVGPNSRPGLEIILRSFNSDERLNSRIVFPDGDWQASPPTASIWSFLSFCTNVAPTAPVDGKMAATCTFKLSGKPTFLAA